jgi:hypothetical protein
MSDIQTNQDIQMHPDDYEELLNDYLHPSGLDTDDFNSIQDAADFVHANVTWSNLPSVTQG